MRYTNRIEIALPQEQVARMLADPALMPQWLRGMLAHEPIEGEHRQVGTISRIVWQQGRGQMEATETITRREPSDLSAITPGTVVVSEREIVARGMWNRVQDRLIATGPGTTRWESDSEFRFDSLPMRLMARVMSRAFRTMTQQHMQDFQDFAERGKDVRGTES